MILADLAIDLRTKIQAIPEFGGRVGLSLGSQEYDPSLIKLEHPGAWIVYFGASEVSEIAGQAICPPQVEYTFLVYAITDYKTDDNLINNVFPLLDSLKTAVHATYPQSGGSDLIGADKWEWVSEDGLEVKHDRMVFGSTFICKADV